MVDHRTASISAVFVLALAGQVSAHHSVNVDFSDELGMIEGVVTRVSFIHPHVRLNVDVTDEAGVVTGWQLETRPPTNLRMDGWESDTIQVGDRVSVTGELSRRGRDAMWITSINVEGGPSIRIGEAEASTELAAPANFRTSAEIAGELASERPVDITGSWSNRYKFRATVDDLEPKPTPFTSVARQLREANRVFGQDYALRCIPTGLPRIFGAPAAMEIHDLGAYYLILYNAGGNALRRVYMDGRSAPEDWELSMLGFSVGRWEGESLVIETIHLKPMWLDGSGLPMSGEATRLVETYTPSPDGATMDRTMVIHDPLYTEPLVRERGSIRSAEPMTENVCDPDSFYSDLLKEGLIEDYFEQKGM